MERLNQADWQELARLVLRDLLHHDEDTPEPALRSALVRIVELMAQAPPSAIAEYAALDEPVLASVPRSAAVPVAQLGALARRIDAWLKSAWQNNGARMVPAAWRCTSDSGHGYFVVPRTHARPVGPKQSFARRGIVLHAVLPAVIHGQAVDIRVADDFPAERPLAVSRGAPIRLVLGAAITPGVEPVVPEGADRFLVTGLEGEAHAGSAPEEILPQASDAGCFAVCWPELTVPPDLLGRIGQGLRMLGRLSWPRFVVAGSWHVGGAKGPENRLAVLDRYGNEVLVYAKRLPFDGRSLDIGVEAIVPGERIAVLLTTEAILSFAICLDFCARGEMADAMGYTRLPVDLMVVPSMGNETTLNGHLATAHDISRHHGAKSFVLQHTVKDRDGKRPACAAVVAYDGRGAPQVSRQDTPWEIYHIRL